MWKTATLGESCVMYQPKTISTKEMISDGKYLVYGANGVIGKYDKYNHEAPQLLITCRGATCGSVNISAPYSWITGNAMVIKPNESEILLRFMEYIFRGGIDLSRAITGSAQPQITRKSLEPIKIAYPPLAAQQRIVEKLDRAFAEIDKGIDVCKKQLRQSELFLQRTLDVTFSPVKSKVCFDSIVKTKGTGLERRSDLQSPSNKYPYLKMNNITASNVLDVTNFTAVNASKEELNKYTLNDGDFLFNTRNSIELVGKTAVVRGLKGWVFNNNILRIKFIEKYIADYVNEYLCTSEGKQQLSARKTGTTNVAAIYYKDLKTVEIPSASISEQKDIVFKLKKYRAYISDYQRNCLGKLRHLAKLKSSILKQALQPPQQ